MQTFLALMVALVVVAILCVLAVRAIGGNVRLVADWRRAWRYYTTWAFLLLGAMPDIYNTVVTSGLLDADGAPEELAWGMRGAALLGLLLRLVRQHRPVAVADEGAPRA